MPARAHPRIVFLHTSAVSYLFVRGQLEHFASRGFETHYGASFDGVGHIDPPEGVTVWPLPFVRPPAPLHDLRALVATVRLLRRLRPDVVHAGTPKAALLGMLAACALRVPVRIDAVHGLRYQTATGAGRRVLRTMERIAAWCATDVAADSASLRDELVGGLGVPARTVSVLGPGSSNGIDLDRFTRRDRAAARSRFGIPVERRVLGFVGRLTRDKGIDDLVELHRRLAGSGTGVGLLLVGQYEDDDPVAPATRAWIAERSDVMHVPWTDQPELAYAAMDLLVFPSAREGLPNVPLEAQASGVPVVGYAATGTVDAVADPAELVQIGDIDALTASVRRLLDDDAARAAAADVAMAWVARFDRRSVWAARCDFVVGRLAARRAQR